VYSLMGMGSTGRRSIAEAIAANECISLVNVLGFELSEYLDMLGIPDEMSAQGNVSILAHIRKRHLLNRHVKSARGGAR
jgi:hypothetical protein